MRNDEMDPRVRGYLEENRYVRNPSYPGTFVDLVSRLRLRYSWVSYFLVASFFSFWFQFKLDCIKGVF
jgi:hypothetical protein